MEPIIKLENVSLWYEKGKPIEVQALKNISTTITRGDYVAFFGPSGCGKTTMLYSISGIDRFQEGKLFINGKDISGLSNQELAIFRQTGIGIVFQQFNLVPSLNVLKNIALPMLFVGISSEKADKEAYKLLERLKLVQLKDRFPFELSGGQQQRIAIARALANDPPIIIADEPLGNLDSTNAKIVLELLKELNQKDGRTIIMVTHEAWSLRDVKTIYHMKDGIITDIEHVKEKEVAKSLSDHLYKEMSSEQKKEEPKKPEVKEEQKTEDDKKGEISSRVLSGFLMRGYSRDEIKRFEYFVNQRLAQKIDTQTFRDSMRKPFKDGGLGFMQKKADRMVDYVEEVIDKRKDLEVVYSIIEKHPELPIAEEIRLIREWLLVDHKLKLSLMKVMAIDQLISDVIKGYIAIDKFTELLTLPVSKFGAGLSFRTAQKMTEKMTQILTTGGRPDEDSVEIKTIN